MGKSSTPPEPQEDHRVELDERWMAEWLTYGFDALDHLLRRHMAYLEWCLRHHRDDTEEGGDDL